MTKPQFPVMKLYTVFIVVIIIVVVVTTVAFLLVNTSDASREKETIIGDKAKKCHSRCTMVKRKKPRNSWEFNLTDIADELLADMDLTVDPCKNFFQFVCGNVEDTHLPIYHLMGDLKCYTRHHITMNNVREELKVIMSEKSPSGEIQALKNVRNFYKACIKLDGSLEGNIHTLGQILKKFGSWPLLDSSWNEEIFTWTDCMQNFSEIGYDVFLTPHYNGTDGDGYHFFSLDIALPLFRYNELAKGLNNSIVSVFVKRMVKLVESMGAVSPAEPDLWKALAFDEKLYNITLQTGARRNKPDKLHMRELIKLNYLNISWWKYLSMRTPSHFDLKNDTLFQLVIVTQTEHQYAQQQALENLVKHTPKRVQANYAFLRFLANFTRFSDNLENRQNDCYNFVSSRLPLATDILYVRNYFKQDFKSHIHQMIKDIWTRMEAEAEQVVQVHKDEMQKLLRNITVLIGYPDEFFDNQSVSNYYDGLVIKDQDFLQGLLNYMIYRRQLFFQLLSNSSIHKSWQQYKNIEADVNIQADLKIRIPAGFLHGSYFHLQQPQYMNYGALGTDIGTLTANTLSKSNSNKTDEMKYWGIHSAYLAYKKRMAESNTVEPSLRKMENFNDKQMFWISLMHTKCTKNDKKNLDNLTNFDFYIPMIKSLDFQNDFACNPI